MLTELVQDALATDVRAKHHLGLRGEAKASALPRLDHPNQDSHCLRRRLRLSSW